MSTPLFRGPNRPTANPAGKFDEHIRFSAREYWRPRAIRAAVIGLIASLVLFGVAVLIVQMWRPNLPELVGAHWSDSGGPNRFTSVNRFLVEMGLILLTFLPMFFAFGMFWGRDTIQRRLWAGLNVWMTGLMAGIMLTVLWLQLGVGDPSQTHLDNFSFNFGLALSLITPTIPAYLTTLFIPRDPPTSGYLSHSRRRPKNNNLCKPKGSLGPPHWR